MGSTKKIHVLNQEGKKNLCGRGMANTEVSVDYKHAEHIYEDKDKNPGSSVSYTKYMFISLGCQTCLRYLEQYLQIQ